MPMAFISIPMKKRNKYFNDLYFLKRQRILYVLSFLPVNKIEKKISILHNIQSVTGLFEKYNYFCSI